MAIGTSKYILIMFICINLVTIVMANVASQSDTRFAEQIDNSFLLSFFILDSDIDFSRFGGKGMQINATFQEGIEQSITPQTSGSSILPTSNVTLFLDVMKMVVSLLAFLTPIPFIAFMVSMGLPILINVLFTIPLFMIWILGLIEFIRGATMQ